jgi:hypothetical protein
LSLDPSKWIGAKQDCWLSYQKKKTTNLGGWNSEKSKRRFFDRRYIVVACENAGLTIIRRKWAYIYSSKCDKLTAHDLGFYIDNPHHGCGFCSGCLVRGCQALIEARTFQGNADKTVLPYLHHFFHHTKYHGKYDLQKWAGLEIHKLAAII